MTPSTLQTRTATTSFCWWLLATTVALSGCGAFRNTENKTVATTPPTRGSASFTTTQDLAGPAALPPFPQAGPAGLQPDLNAQEDGRSSSAAPIWLVGDRSGAPVPAVPASQPPDPRSATPPAEPRSPGMRAAHGVLYASEATFEQRVLRSETPVLVDFYATWCGPCRELASTLEELAAEHPEVKVVKVDVDDSPELAARYRVASVPTLLLFRNDRVVARQKGIASKARLQAMVDLPSSPGTR